MREVARPLSFGKPSEKICEDLKKKDGQICELRYGEYRCTLRTLLLIGVNCKVLKITMGRGSEISCKFSEHMAADYVTRFEERGHFAQNIFIFCHHFRPVRALFGFLHFGPSTSQIQR